MAKSRSPGNSSSLKKLSPERVNELLRPAIDDAGVRTIYSILGKDSQLALVGGCIRELLSTGLCTDIDLAVKFDPHTVKNMLEGAGMRVIETGIEHGTVLAVISEQHYELTTFRQPGVRTSSVYSDSLETDLSGRDFTVNAIAYDLNLSALIDPYSGVIDLDSGVLRAVGDARERFREDPLRILRMVRFGAAAGRTIDAETSAAAQELRQLLSSVSVERIRAEVEQILLSQHAAEGFRTLASHGLLEFSVPELIQTIGVEQNDFHVHDVFEHTLDVISNCPHDRILRLTALFHDIAKPATLTVDEDGHRHFYLHEKVGANVARSAMSRMKYSHQDIDTVSLLVDTHMRPLTCGPQGLRRLMRELGGHFDTWLQFKHADKPPRGDPAEFEQSLAHFLALLETEKKRTVGSVYSSLAVKGEDVMKAGVPRGPRIGAILKQLNDEVLDVPERNTREYLLSRIAKIASTKDDDP